MGLVFDRTVSPTAHYYMIEGRAAEIAFSGRSAGRSTCSWRCSTAVAGDRDLARPRQAEAAVRPPEQLLTPPRPRFLVPDGFVLTRGGEVAFELGDGYWAWARFLS
jgi:hypothetical protein